MKKYYVVIFTTIFYLLGYFACSQTTESKDFNGKGFKFYKNKEYGQAVDAFNAAITKDPTNYIAQFNLACTYAILTTLHENCNTNYYAKAIQTLGDCFEINPAKTRKKAIKDADFDGIRNEYEFVVLIDDLSFDNPKHVKSFIENKTYSTSSIGSFYFPIEKLKLNENGTYVYTYHENASEMHDYSHGDRTPEEKAPELILGTKEGIWQLNGHVLILVDDTQKEFGNYTLTHPSTIGEFYYPDPNDMSGESELRHNWKCGKCGCLPIEGLNGL